MVRIFQSKRLGIKNSIILEDLVIEKWAFSWSWKQKRGGEFSYEHRQLIAKTLNELPDWFLKRNLIEAFSKSLSETASERLYEAILSKGIIHFDPLGKYSAPIPSLRSFLIDEYG
ncbi:MAG: hypothetical protein OXC67_05385 [Flavobacteriaceae bacterium]|nr:hypothetical protein [Flavobacteriaceae bacterium]